jgi:hypothetical protein
MQFGKPFSFVFEDPDWLKKLAILALLGFAQLIPVLGSLFMAAVFSGVMIDIMRKVINKQTPTIPNMDIGKQFMDGLKVWVIGLVYSIPTVVLGIVIAIIAALGGGVGIWGSNNDNAGAAGAAGVVVIILISCVGLIILLYSLLVAFITPAFYGRYAQFGTIGSALNFKEVFKTAFKKPVPYLLALVGVIVVGIVGGIAGSILSSIGAIALGIGALYGVALATVWMSLANGHFFGQAYLTSTEETV